MPCFEVISRHLLGCVVPMHVIKTRGSVGIVPLIHNRALDVG